MRESSRESGYRRRQKERFDLEEDWLILRLWRVVARTMLASRAGRKTNLAGWLPALRIAATQSQASGAARRGFCDIWTDSTVVVFRFGVFFEKIQRISSRLLMESGRAALNVREMPKISHAL
jgi:hypothetical protein